MSDEEDDMNWGEDSCSIYNYTRADINVVNVANWYNLFKELCPKTILVDIPPEVLKYLKACKMVMPKRTFTTAQLNRNAGSSWADGEKVEVVEYDSDDSWGADPGPDLKDEGSIIRDFIKETHEVHANQLQELEMRLKVVSLGPTGEDDQSMSSASSEEELRKEVDKFQEFDSFVDARIKELGGIIIPKINRKSPKDAAWINLNKSVKCYGVGDAYLLLKTSDEVSHVLEDPYRGCCDEVDEGAAGPDEARSSATTSTSPFVLVLKQWIDSWGPEMEYRCFICSNELIAISQRDVNTYYNSVKNRKEKIVLDIQNFFLKYIRDKFSIDFYVMDIVCHPNGEIYLVDFDVFGLCTDPLLFTYRELQSIYKEKVDSVNGITDNKQSESLCGDNPRKAFEPHFRCIGEGQRFVEGGCPDMSYLIRDVVTYIRNVKLQ